MEGGHGAGWALMAATSENAPPGSDASLQDALAHFATAPVTTRMAFLEALMPLCNVRELSHLESLIGPQLKVDFLQRFPMEVAFHVLEHLEEPYALTRAAAVSKTWYRLANDEHIWGNLCVRHGYNTQAKLRWMLTSLIKLSSARTEPMQEDAPRIRLRASFFRYDASDVTSTTLSTNAHERISLKQYFQLAYLTERNWLCSGRLLTVHISDELADANPDPNRRLALTCCAIDANYIVVGMTTRTVFVFSARTGELIRTLNGHESGVWCLMLASGTNMCPPPLPGIERADGMQRAFVDRARSARLSLFEDESRGVALSDVLDAAQLGAGERDALLGRTRGWGRPDTLLVSAGSDRFLRVWNMTTGECEHVLRGHTSTIRCVQVLDGRPIAVSGSRDGTLRVWDLEQGKLMHVLAGHQHSVRCLDTAGNRVASGSYDFTCRIWDVDTGRCLHVLKGHHLQIYAIAFDGRYVVAGSSDSTVRVWDADTGACLAVFQGYTHVVAQLQLYNDVLASGSGDGRVIVFSLKTFECLYRLCAHDSSVSTLQMNDKFLVTGGADGLVKLWDARTGRYLRQLCEPCDTVWAVRFWEDKCVILCTPCEHSPRQTQRPMFGGDHLVSAACHIVHAQPKWKLGPPLEYRAPPGPGPMSKLAKPGPNRSARFTPPIPPIPPIPPYMPPMPPPMSISSMSSTPESYRRRFCASLSTPYASLHSLNFSSSPPLSGWCLSDSLRKAFLISLSVAVLDTLRIL